MPEPRAAPEEPEAAALARDALARARSCEDPAEALRWLERAHRVVPLDPNIMLALATALLASDPVRAAQLFVRVTTRHDVLEGRLGQVAAALRTGQLPDAITSLAHVLSHHALRPATADIARTVVRAAGMPGFCGLDLDGTVTVEAAGRVAITLDGVAVRGLRLPRGWQRCRQLSVRAGGLALLGSPVLVPALCRTVGLVEAADGGLCGWAWHPADRERPARLTLLDRHGRRLGEIEASDPSIIVPDLGPLAAPRGFVVPPPLLARANGPVYLRGIDGRDLYGSPIEPDADQRDAAAMARWIGGGRGADARPRSGPLPASLAMPRRTAARTRKAAGVDIVVPVHGQAALTLSCLESLFATVRPPHRIVVVDDASPDPALAAALDGLARARRIRLIRTPRNLGFPGAANTGLRAAGRRDVVLLNNDTQVPDRWLDRLRSAAYAAPDIGTVTPLSNDASILSYPGPAGTNPPPPDAAALRQLDRLTQKACGDVTVDIPVGVGFCLYLRRDCLDEVGLLREDVFAQGYGEENDFCLRARRLGWRSVALPGLFVAHHSGGTFGSGGSHLRRRNQDLLERLHPGQAKLVGDFCDADPLLAWRRRIDLARWRAARGRHWRGAVALITHDEGGGVEARIAQSCATHRAQGLRPLVLRPAAGGTAVHLSDDGAGDWPNLIFRLPDDLRMLERLLRAEKAGHFEVHHFLNHHPLMHDLPGRMGLPTVVHVHDYAWFCPRVALVDGKGRYCGEPGPAGCAACIADYGALVPDSIGPDDLHVRSAAFLSAAARVVAPSADTAARMTRHFPGLRVSMLPHENDRTAFRQAPPTPRRGPVRVCVPGAIGVHKGYDVLLACARDAAARSLDLEFVVAGTTIDDARLMRTGKVFITGAYQSGTAVELIAAQQADLGFLPSIWPETWSLALTELWRAGLQVAAFDIGAPAERIRENGNGFLLPPHLPPGAINNALTDAAAHRSSRHAASIAR